MIVMVLSLLNHLMDSYSFNGRVTDVEPRQYGDKLFLENLYNDPRGTA